MKERPILFSGAMVRAILDGTKTQTRRVISNVATIGRVTEFGRSDTTGYDWTMRDSRLRWNDLRHKQLIDRCPYGQPGDRLWVRETFQRFTDDGEILYKAGPAGFEAMNELKRDECPEARWRPAIHMPRWASRITLEVTGVRVERLQEISGADAVAEGVRSRLPDNGIAVAEYRDLWEGINGAESWSANPWVWVIEFEVVK